MQVLEARVDHARVVKIMRTANHLPLVKDYLLAVQKTNLAAVNEAVNQLLIEEEVSTPLRCGVIGSRHCQCEDRHQICNAAIHLQDSCAPCAHTLRTSSF